MRSWRSETATLAMIMALPAAIWLAMPYDALDFRAKRPTEAAPFAAWVTVSEPVEHEAVRVAKSILPHGDGVIGGRLRANLRMVELPVYEDRFSDAVEVSCPRLPPLPEDFQFGAFQPGMGAVAPVRIEPLKPLPVAPAFSREELLQIR